MLITRDLGYEGRSARRRLVREHLEQMAARARKTKATASPDRTRGPVKLITAKR